MVNNMNEKQYIEFLQDLIQVYKRRLKLMGSKQRWNYSNIRAKKMEDLNKKIEVLTNELENITHVQGGNKNE